MRDVDRSCVPCSIDLHSTHFFKGCVLPPSSTQWRLLVCPTIERWLMVFLSTTILVCSLAPEGVSFVGGDILRLFRTINNQYCHSYPQEFTRVLH